MSIIRTLQTLAGGVAALLLVATSGASAAVKTGTLTCNVNPGVGLLIMSTKGIECGFRSINGHRERYIGKIQNFGLDIGATTSGTIVWDVFSESNRPASLSGNYAGVDAQATVGAGVGANVLVGGSNRSISLQPVSVTGQTGLNLAGGVGDLSLERVR